MQEWEWTGGKMENTTDLQVKKNVFKAILYIPEWLKVSMIILYLLFIFILFYINADHYIFIRILLGPNI